jgi:AraC family L-rhamnose operon regulatory protein RhaS
MLVYSKERYLESDEFAFAAFPYSTMPDRPFTPHLHEFVELVYVDSGCGEHLYKGNRFPVSKGDLFVIPPYAEHDYRVIGDAPLDVYNILFLPSFLVSELKVLSQVTPFVQFFYVEPFMKQNPDFESHLKLSRSEAEEVKQRLDRIVREFRDKALGYRITVKALLIELLVWLSRRYEPVTAGPPFQTRDSEAIRKLCEFLDTHYAEPLQLEQVCRMCGMSQSAFTAKFKEVTGKTFTGYRNELRIQSALELLRGTDEKVIHIAERVGIGDSSYFNKLFREQIGISPRDYRRLART